MQKNKSCAILTSFIFGFLFSSTAWSQSSTTSAPYFDWNAHQGEAEVDHPLGAKGLSRITKDKTYIYKVNQSAQKSAVSFKVGTFDPVNLENPDTGATFAENYDSTSNPAVLVDYEWQLWRSSIGKWGLKAGSGFFIAQGHGQFASATTRAAYSEGPREVLTFVAFPNTAAVVYRLGIWDRQMLVPYAEAGFIGFTFAEIRDDSASPKFGAAPATFFALGCAFNLTYFNPLSMIQLDHEYGINNVYFTAEYRNVVGLSDKFDFTSELINGGVLLEF